MIKNSGIIIKIKKRTFQMNLHQLEQIAKRPEDFKVLERVPLTKCDTFPLVLDCLAGDEIDIVVLDVETTGLDKDVHAVTELGLTGLRYSPSLGKITSVTASGAWYQDPKQPIPPFIQNLTGISDADVQGKQIEGSDIAHYFENDPLVIAHNASFDRGFCSKYIESINPDLRWACSVTSVDWSAAGLGSKALEFILYRLGFFYDGHRANTDTLALVYVFIERPELLKELIANADKRTAIIRAFDSPYAAKEELKSKGFKWSEEGTHPKHWYLECDESLVEGTMAALELIYPASKHAKVEYLGARDRYKA